MMNVLTPTSSAEHRADRLSVPIKPASCDGCDVLPTVADSSIPEVLKALWEALNARRFFKVISGGSFTNVDKIAALTAAYAASGVDCIDIAPDPLVVDTVAAVLKTLDSPSPVVMVSLPLDPDPHFRKIELDEPACIRCGLCLPVCPSEALTLPDALTISQTLCYGCSRCVPVCPTQALSMLPFQVEDQVETVLRHPVVQAVEIHSRYIDPFMLEAFWTRWESGLRGKLVSLCFRPQGFSAAQILEFVEVAQRRSTLPILLQIDGAPMSGNSDPEASRPALESARFVQSVFEQAKRVCPIVTISGGINDHTACLLQDPPYHFVSGVGMGTVARQKIRDLTADAAAEAARLVVQAFKSR